jgi:hypothetical protein
MSGGGMTTESVQPASETYGLDITLLPEAHDIVMVLSDGVRSFTEEYEPGRFRPVPLMAVLEQMFALNGCNGEFLTRRARKFLTRYCRDHKWTHDDDFSGAAIHIG